MNYPSPETIFGYFLFFLPGIVAFFVYRFLSDKDLGDLDKLDFLLIIFFAFISRSLTRFEITEGNITYQKFISESVCGVLCAFLPDFLTTLLLLLASSVIIGAASDILYRVLVNHQFRYDSMLTHLGLNGIDTNDTPVWVTKIREEWWESSKDFKKARKLNVVAGTETITGYLTGFSETDLEITHIEYDEEDEELNYTETWISKDDISQILFLNERVEDSYSFSNQTDTGFKRHILNSAFNLKLYFQNLPGRVRKKLEYSLEF